MYINANKCCPLIGFIIFSLFEVAVARNGAADGYTGESFDDYDFQLQCKPSVLPPSPKSMCCGIDVSSSNRIVGGSPTLLNQYPWLAIILYKVKGHDGYLFPKCGGSLISSLYVVTAAHCAAGDILKTSTPHEVVLGDYDKYHSGPDCVRDANGLVRCSEGEVRIDIEKYTAHKFYSNNPTVNDIALIKLKKMAPYTDFIRPICLPTSDLGVINSNKIWLTVAGWGVMKQVKNGTEYTATSSDVKRHLQLPYVPHQYCKVIRKEVTNNQICAGGIKGQDACMGDSGGPLMFNNDGQFVLTGAVSYGAGKPCGGLGIPSVYTNVYKYKEWIMNEINNKKPSLKRLQDRTNVRRFNTIE